MPETPLYAEVAARILAGETPAEAALALGREYDKMRGDIHRARRAGLLPPFTPKKGREVRGAAGLRRGSMRQIIEVIGPETLKWIVKNVSANATLAEVIGAILKDVHYEETSDPRLR